jgi:hypothetical protein
MTAERWTCESKIRHSVSFDCVFLSLVVSMAQFCGAQSAPSTSPAFTVATIKSSDLSNTGDDGDIGFSPAGSFDAKTQTLKELIAFAYNWRYYDLIRWNCSPLCRRGLYCDLLCQRRGLEQPPLSH